MIMFSGIDILTVAGGILMSGARNTSNKSDSDSRQEVGFSISGFNAGSSAEYKTRMRGICTGRTCCGFSSYPAVFSYPESMISRLSFIDSALEKRSNKKGTLVFLHPFIRVPAVYPFTHNEETNLDNGLAGSGILVLGANNTLYKSDSDSRQEVGFLFSGFNAGSSREYKTHSWGIPAGRTCTVLLATRRFFHTRKVWKTAQPKIFRSNKAKYKKGTKVLLHPFIRVPAVYPFTHNEETNLDSITCFGVILSVGARNTYKTSDSDSRQEVGFSISGFNAGSSREYKTHLWGIPAGRTFCGFSSYPAVFSYPESMISRLSFIDSALEKRSKTKDNAVFLHPFIGVPAVYPFTNCLTALEVKVVA